MKKVIIVLMMMYSSVSFSSDELCYEPMQKTFKLVEMINYASRNDPNYIKLNKVQVFQNAIASIEYILDNLGTIGTGLGYDMASKNLLNAGVDWNNHATAMGLLDDQDLIDLVMDGYDEDNGAYRYEYAKKCLEIAKDSAI
ncbi:MAG: hypothetical protein ABL867_05815 [Rickettsiales bacterium]